MVNRSVETMLSILNEKRSKGLPDDKEKRTQIWSYRRKYEKMLRGARKVNIPRKAWKYVENFGILANYMEQGEIPVPYDNQVLVFHPPFKISAVGSTLEFAHVYRYTKKRDFVFPHYSNINLIIPPMSYVPIGDVGIQLVFRHKSNFPSIVAAVIQDEQLILYKGTSETWEIVDFESVIDNRGHYFVSLIAMFVINCLAFVSEPQFYYEFQQKKTRIPRDLHEEKRQKEKGSPIRESGRHKRRNKKIRQRKVVFEEKPDLQDKDKRNWTEPEYAVEVCKHKRTYNYCAECQGFLPLRLTNRKECVRCGHSPLVLTQKEVWLKKPFWKYGDKPKPEQSPEIWLDVGDELD